MKLSHCQTLPMMLLLAAMTASGGVDDLKKCLFFKAPPQKSIIVVPVCTLGVAAYCKGIDSVEIRVHYFPENAETAIDSTIGKIDKPPFQKIWNLKNIPNQLSFGIGIIIAVSFSDGDAFGLKREGIFLAHQPFSCPAQRLLPYEYPGTAVFPQDTIAIPSSKSGFRSFAQMYWNEKAITVKVSVRDTLFNPALAQKVLEQMGIEILIDPARKRKPYPTEEAMIFTVPLSGEPSIKTYKPEFRDSTTYQLNKVRVKTKSDFDYTIEKSNHSGFSITFSIPQYLLGKSLPAEIGYNIIVKTADAKGKIIASSLINASGYNNYSPFLWAALSFLPKPIFKERWLILIIFFFAGLLLPLLVHFISLVVVKDRPILILHKHPDTVKRTFTRIKETVDRAITRKDLTAGGIATELNMAPKELEATIKKITRMSFRNYVMYLRTEIVCERLRSSHSSQASIAETCGFLNVKEMERYFQRFHHMTTVNFRKTQQIARTQ